ncbi:benzoate 4-monooxygenase cytochrome P450 [Teratosphaeria nubilosa]|uniref:Benzoate 4-monooxygenase cytochrome P450 n=1 Tax=Teratosphaeria nubilosa TaxID=161662 RepID=A0A6G1LL50_9PEZI|nr:benzoate 4-monooxygenase cytochrome P450 [Teratosphaeria nubilosa]
MLTDSSIGWPLTWAATTLFSWLLLRAIYRRRFHPLSSIPGPFWCSISTLPSFYHNFILHGQWYREIDRLHARYGPVIRIGPNEVHLSDPAAYDKIYSNASPFYKDPHFYHVYGMEKAMFCTIPNDLHKRRRAPLNHFFSKKAIMEYEDIVQSKVSLLCQRIEAAFSHEKDGSVDLGRAFKAMSVDIVTDYAFSSSLGLLEDADFGAWFGNMLREGAPLFWVFQQLPFTKSAVESLPASVSRRWSPAVRAWETFIQVTNPLITRTMLAAGIEPKRRTMFHHMLDPRVPEGRLAPSDSNPTDEAMSLTAAGADSTGNAASFAIFHIVTDANIHKRVMTELRQAFPDPSEECRVAVLEKCAYFVGAVKEAQRMSYGVIGRLPRKSPANTLFNGYCIPPGTTVSMSTWTMHRNPDAFPAPDTFDPARWLTQDAAQLRRMERCFVPFGRGPRMCLGHALATCELLCAVATVLRRFPHVEVLGTRKEDLVYEDYVGAVHPGAARPFKVVRGRHRLGSWGRE